MFASQKYSFYSHFLKVITNFSFLNPSYCSFKRFHFIYPLPPRGERVNNEEESSLVDTYLNDDITLAKFHESLHISISKLLTITSVQNSLEKNHLQL